MFQFKTKRPSIFFDQNFGIGCLERKNLLDYIKKNISHAFEEAITMEAKRAGQTQDIIDWIHYKLEKLI